MKDILSCGAVELEALPASCLFDGFERPWYQSGTEAATYVWQNGWGRVRKLRACHSFHCERVCLGSSMVNQSILNTRACSLESEIEEAEDQSWPC